MNKSEQPPKTKPQSPKMREIRSSSAWQPRLVWLLFLASIGTLFFNSMTAPLLPSQELSVREQLREASLKLVDASSTEVDQQPIDAQAISPVMNGRLEELTRDVLGRFPGIEGGFYFNHHHDEFAGYAFPSEPARGPRHETRREPPPREEPYIRIQARQTATQDGSEPLIQVRDVGPSRVAVATAPIGATRPARMVVWLMYRLTGPEQLHWQIYRYQISTLLALGGITAALLLTLNLRRTLERERQSRERLRDELRRSEHLSSLGLLVAQVAHELRNPLAGIRSTVQLWQRLPGESQTPESMQAVITAVDRLDGLLTNLLQFSRAESTDGSLVNLNTVIQETVELLRAQATQQHVLLELKLDPGIPAIPGSPGGLRQVILNLATNALQAMPSTGRLACATKWNQIDNDVVIEIADTGPGIAAEVRSRLFEPFFTTRPHGTGLGLALCREIILQHGGRIDLESLEPHGTACRVTLPKRN